MKRGFGGKSLILESIPTLSHTHVTTKKTLKEKWKKKVDNPLYGHPFSDVSDRHTKGYYQPSPVKWSPQKTGILPPGVRGGVISRGRVGIKKI